MLCAVGGLIGIAAGGLLTLLLKLLLGSVLPARMSAIWSAIAFTVSCAIGLLFGIYPALEWTHPRVRQNRGTSGCRKNRSPAAVRSPESQLKS